MKRTLEQHTDVDDIVRMEQDVAYMRSVLLDMHGCMDSPSEISVHYHPIDRVYHIYAFGYRRPVRLDDLRLVAIGIESTRSFSCHKGNSVYIDMRMKAPHRGNQGALVVLLKCADPPAPPALVETRGRKLVALADDAQEERPRSRSLVRSVFSALTGL